MKAQKLQLLSQQKVQVPLLNNTLPADKSGWQNLTKTFLHYALIALLVSLLLNPVLEARMNSAYFVAFITVIGGAIGVSRFRFLLVFSAWLLAFSYAVLSLTPLAKNLAPYFIVNDPLPTSADAIVVLSAESPYSNVVKTQGLERLLHGKSLLQANLATTLVLTDLPWYRGDPHKDRQFLLGDLIKNTVSIGPVENTYDEAQALKKLAAQHGWKQFILVTSPLHSRRAKAIFSEQLPELTIISSPSAAREFDINLLITSYDKLRASRLMLYEVAAWGKNFILGRL